MTKPIDLLAELDTKYADYRAAFEAMREALTVCLSDLDSEVKSGGQVPCEREPLRAALALADKVSRADEGGV